MTQSRILIDLLNNTEGLNDTESQEAPSEIFDSVKRDLIIYSILFILSAVGNMSVFISLLKNRNRKLRINLLIFNLSIADLIVTFVMIPLEIGWRITKSWVAGDLACRVLQALRAFGPYLSSMVLICVSLDRYFAIIHPLKVHDAQRRSRIMLTFAWMISIVCSVPQSIIFHVESHPDYPTFKQCVTFNFFQTQWQDTFYNLFFIIALYFVPLLIIIICYARILWEIYRRSRTSKSDSKENSESKDGENHAQRGGARFQLRRSDMTQIDRARTRTLRMTIIIVLAFVWCWTPYAFMVILYQINSEFANKLDKSVQDTLYMFAVSNSVVNPLVYGSYTLNFKLLWKRFFGRKNDTTRTASKRVKNPKKDVRNSPDECTIDSTVDRSPSPNQSTDASGPLLTNNNVIAKQSPRSSIPNRGKTAPPQSPDCQYSLCCNSNSNTRESNCSTPSSSIHSPLTKTIKNTK